MRSPGHIGIAGYEVLTQRRRRQRRRETTDVELHLRADQRLRQDDALIEEELAAALGQVAALLSAEDRALLGLDASSAQQADASRATQRKRRQRSLERLRDLWRSFHGGS